MHLLKINSFAFGLTKLKSNLHSFFGAISRASNGWLINSFSFYHSNLHSPFPFGAIKLISPSQSKSISQSSHRKPNALSKESLLKQAVASMKLDSEAYVSILQACMDTKSISQGNQLHAHMVVNGVEQETSLKTKLLSFYVACGRMDDARLIFNRMSHRNVFLWNEMIRGYAWNEPFEDALALYYQMEQGMPRMDMPARLWHFTIKCSWQM